MRDTRIRYPLKRRLQCRMYVCKPLRIKSFHRTLAVKAHKCPPKSRLGKVTHEKAPSMRAFLSSAF